MLRGILDRIRKITGTWDEHNSEEKHGAQVAKELKGTTCCLRYSEENTNGIFVKKAKWNTKKGIYCSQRMILEALHLVIIGLSHSFSSGNRKQFRLA